MTDPRLEAQIDQAAASVRDAFDSLGVNCADPDVFFAVKVTAMFMAQLDRAEMPSFIRCINAMGPT